jgi:hypothetical protein
MPAPDRKGEFDSLAGSSTNPGNAKLPVGGRRSAIQENGVLGWKP